MCNKENEVFFYFYFEVIHKPQEEGKGCLVRLKDLQLQFTNLKQISVEFVTPEKFTLPSYYEKSKRNLKLKCFLKLISEDARHRGHGHSRHRKPAGQSERY